MIKDTHIFYGDKCVPIMYTGEKAKLYLMNDSSNQKKIYEDEIYHEYYEKDFINISKKNKIVSDILNNCIPQEERKFLLQKYYKYINGNNFNINKDNFFLINSKERHERIELLKTKTRLSHLPINQQKNLWNIISSYNDVFNLPGDPTPVVSDVEHEILLKTGKPISSKVYRQPIHIQDKIDAHIEESEKKKVIRPSSSPYSANVLLVPKKMDASGEIKWRPVFDYRKLNAETEQDNYPIPCIEEILCLLGNSKYMSAFDCANGFHQVAMKPRDIPKTAFSTHRGHWEWVKMPMGLKNSPATFQSMVNYKLRGLIVKFVLYTLMI